jgi:glycosyltransferase involved in cell wall biosynthesis/ADP-heptose:LPS heptosyltransferase
LKPNLLVVELWGLGDLAIATPFLKCASERYNVTLLAKPYAHDLNARFWPKVKVIPFVAPWTAFRRKYRLLVWPWRELSQLRRLRKYAFDIGISARWDPRDHFLLCAFRARKRIGFPRLGSGLLLTDPVRRPESSAHRYEYWRTVAEALGLELSPTGKSLVSADCTHRLVIVHSGAGQPVRVWPLPRYRTLVAQMRQRGFDVQVACDPDQREWWLAHEPNVVTPSNAAELIAWLERAGAFIGNDSGPGHLAAILGVPTFTLFGPQLPERFAPLHTAAEWLEGNPCHYKPCSDYCRFPSPVCIEGLEEKQVCARVELFLAKNVGDRPVILTPPTIAAQSKAAAPRVKLALSILCEDPNRRTGLSTLFPAFVSESLRLFPDVDWIIFAGQEQPWSVTGKRVEVVRRFPANNHLLARLRADHFRVASAAKAQGAAALLTVGFSPLVRAGLPTIMHVFTVHHMRPGGGLRAAYRRWAIKHGLQCAALVIANSNWTAEHLSVRPGRLLVSYEGLYRELFRPEGPADPSYPNGSYLLWASNFYPYKRADLALAAYARVPLAVRNRFPLLLVGGDWNGGRTKAEATVKELGLSQHVKFLGWVADDQLPALYRGARAHVLSTAEETFGRTVLEAMACGCPCVLQDLPVLREVTADSAVFVDFNDTAAAGAALHAMCVDDALRGKLRASGLERAARFSFERLAKERVEAVLRVVAESQH